jgi:hypothetical protein
MEENLIESDFINERHSFQASVGSSPPYASIHTISQQAFLP